MMRRPLQLACLSVALAAVAAAQFHLPQHLGHSKAQGEDTSWLGQYASPEPDGRAGELLHDYRFKEFLRDHLKAPQSFWNDNESLADTAFEFLSTPGRVLLRDNRYLAVDGCVPHFCPSRGLLFVDLGSPHPLVAFAAVDWTRDNHSTTQPGAEYTLWLFADQQLATDALPAPLTAALTQWSGATATGSDRPQNITNLFLVDPDGTPHPVAPAAAGLTSNHK
ncbi:MAG: hypothetical protein KGK08_04265 [Acidobacteriota bacterium]|nr:hypothetical protein [Acidobacteriota bacterium]